jgi:hypothetical protein
VLYSPPPSPDEPPLWGLVVSCMVALVIAGLLSYLMRDSLYLILAATGAVALLLGRALRTG